MPYRVIKDYYLPKDKETWDVKEWHDHEVFDDLEDAWAKMKRLMTVSYTHLTLPTT